MKNSSFEGKNVYIFGGSSGIGLAAAQQLAGLGANLFIYARNKDGLQAAASQIEKQRRVNTQIVAWMPVDISDNQEVTRVINSSVETGSPDILINCAGRAYPDHFEAITYEQFEETMKIVGNNRIVFGSDTGGHDEAWELGRYLSMPVADEQLIAGLGTNIENAIKQSNFLK